MIDDKFEWDDTKAAANLAKHGVSFERAKLVFQDVAMIDVYDDLHIEREGRVRIISARRATRHERQTYGENRGD